MIHFTLEHPKQFTRITTRLQRVFQNPDIWFPWNSEEDVVNYHTPKGMWLLLNGSPD